MCIVYADSLSLSIPGHPCPMFPIPSALTSAAFRKKMIRDRAVDVLSPGRANGQILPFKYAG